MTVQIHDPQGQCYGKIAHPRRRDAVLHAIEMMEKCGIGYRPYICPHCGYWHVGRTSKGGARRKRDE